MLDALYNRPNHILEKQRLVQNDHRKLWYRLPRSNIYMGLYYTGFTAGLVGCTYGIYSLIRGKDSA